MQFVSYKLTISGHVQGVFYRQSAKEKAISLGISGTVKNLPDGSVEAAITGNPEHVEEFIDWCRKGPSGAKVEKVDIHETPLKNFTGFVIIR
jgi:acylphosphatase